MTYEKYTTKAFILREYEQGEYDLNYKVWTRDFGIIYIFARSIRKINAKLRLNIKKNDFTNITLVKGKEIWRLTGAEEENNLKIDKDEWVMQAKKIMSEIVNKFLEEKKSYKKLFDKLHSIFFTEYEYIKNLDINKFKIFIYYIVLVDTGYADALIIGAKDIEEYKSFSISDLVTHFILNEEYVKRHVLSVLRESML